MNRKSHITEFIQMLSGNNTVHVITMMPDQRLYFAKIWANYKDGFVMISALKDGPTHKNILRDGYLTMTIETAGKPARTAFGDCSVVDIIPDDNHEYASMLERQYAAKRFWNRLPGTKVKRVTLKANLKGALVLPKMRRTKREEFAKGMYLESQAMASDATHPSEPDSMLAALRKFTGANTEDVQKGADRKNPHK